MGPEAEWGLFGPQVNYNQFIHFNTFKSHERNLNKNRCKVQTTKTYSYEQAWHNTIKNVIKEERNNNYNNNNNNNNVNNRQRIMAKKYIIIYYTHSLSLRYLLT